MISRDRVALERVPLAELLGSGGGFIGRMSIDDCPPMDVSPLSDAVATAREAIQRSDETAAQEYLRGFYTLLIEPVIRAGFAPEHFARWIVVPHGALHYLPFAAMLDGEGRFLIERVALTMSPSAAVWLHGQQTPRPTPADAFGLFSPTLADPDLPPLPAAAQEMDAVDDRLSALDTHLIPGDQAVEQQLRRFGPDVDLIHISTHGHFPELNAIDFHEILLAPGNGDDGRLQAREIRDLDLSRVALVVLAICNGGLYSTGPSDEPYGLIPALFGAGVTTVAATLWPLEDAFGRSFVARLYDHLLEEGPAEALRATARSYIEEEELIRRWAGFVTVGPARPFQ